MDELTLTAEVGRPLGSGPARRLRVEGKVPGVLYGLNKDPLVVTVDYRELRQVLTTEAGMNAVITLDVAGEHELSIVKELQRHPVRRDVLHVDFIRLDPDAKVTVDVPIVLVGEAKQVDVGGFVDHVLYDLTIEAKPNAIPTELELDISELEIGSSFTVADLALPAGVTTEVDPEETVVMGSVARVVEEEPVEGEEGEGEEGEEGEGEEGAEASDGEGGGDSDGGADGGGSDGDD